MHQNEKISKRLRAFLERSKPEFTQQRPLDDHQLSSFEILSCLYHGKITKRAILALQTTGCSLLHRRQGGCLHCGLGSDGIISDRIDRESRMEQFKKKLDILDFSDCPVLCVYVPGSFLNEREMDAASQKQLLSVIAGKKDVRKLILESLPQYITDERIKDLKTILPDTEVEIAVGLDSCNDQIRSVCINKNFSITAFEKACGILKRHGVAFSAFALLKPPFLTEREAIIDTVRTAHRIFEMGAAAVSIEPNTVQDNTVVSKLYERNLYRPPWLWSMIEVIQGLPPGFQVRAGGVVVYPRAVQAAHNCSKCTHAVWQKIQEYNLVQDKNIFKDLDCECKQKWKEEIE